MGSDKLWIDVGGRPLVAVTLDALARAECFDTVCVVAPRSRWADLRQLGQAAGLPDLRLVEGGDHRQESVRRGLDAAAGAEVVAVHDAARPLCPPAVFRATVAAAREHGAATAAIPLVDSIKRVTSDGRVESTLDRSKLVAVQTPQAFRRDLLAEAHARALADGVRADDDCALVERLSHEVWVVPGDPGNFKVTLPGDVAALRLALAGPAREPHPA